MPELSADNKKHSGKAIFVADRFSRDSAQIRPGFGGDPVWLVPSDPIVTTWIIPERIPRFPPPRWHDISGGSGDDKIPQPGKHAYPFGKWGIQP